MVPLAVPCVNATPSDMDESPHLGSRVSEPSMVVRTVTVTSGGVIVSALTRVMLRIARESARIFRITHVRNLPWIMEQGLHCRSSVIQDPNFRSIGSVDLIEKRNRRAVPIEPGGTLADYIPFYFTSRTPMLLNIKTGRGVELVPMREIAILVSSLPHLVASSVPFVFTDRHAKLVTANFSCELAQLDCIDWDIMARSDFT